MRLNVLINPFLSNYSIIQWTLFEVTLYVKYFYILHGIKYQVKYSL